MRPPSRTPSLQANRMWGEMGYAFLFRAYRADQGKWQTSDPLGYPDGWNNFAYVNNGVTATIDPLGLSVWQWTKETLAALGYGIIYIVNAVNNPFNPYYFLTPKEIPKQIADLYAAPVVKEMSSVTNAINLYYANVIGNYNNKSPAGTYTLSSRLYPISNNHNTAWGAIVGTSTLRVSGSATVSIASDGGRNVLITLNCNFYDEIDWKSYEELVVDHDGNFLNWGLTTDYFEGALDVWLDQGLRASYKIDVSWDKEFNKHFAE